MVREKQKPTEGEVARMEKIRMASQKLRSGNEMGCYGIMSN
jgi:hypothetical protein